MNINRGLSEFDRPADLTAAIQYVTKGNKWVRNFQIFPMLTAHSGLPLYIGQSNENPAHNASNQQRPDHLGGGVSLYTPGVPNGTGVQFQIPLLQSAQTRSEWLKLTVPRNSCWERFRIARGVYHGPPAARA